MKRSLALAVALIAVLCWTAVVWSQGGRQGQPGQPGQAGPAGRGGFMMSCPAMAVMPPQSAMIDRMAETLQLNADQKSRLRQAMTKGEQTMTPLAQKSAQASQALRAAVLAPQYDAQKVKNLAATAQKAEAAVIDARINQWTQIRSILTASQAAKLQDAMTMRRQGPGERPGGGAGPRPAPTR